MADHKLYIAGTKFKFKGYEALQEGQVAIFAAGDTVVIAETPADQKSFDDGGAKIQSEDGSKVDVAFDTELEAIAAPAARTRAKPAAAPATAAAPVAGAAKLAKPKTAAGKKAAGTKPAKEAKPKAVKAEKEPVATVRTEALTAVLAETPDVLEAIEGLQDTIEQSFFNLGGLCSIVLHEGLYKTQYPDKGGFVQWCEEVMNMGKRKVYTLINMYVKTTAAGFDEKELTNLGWTKARALSQYMDKKDYTEKEYKEDIKYAEKHTRDELEKHLEKKYVKATVAGTAGKASGTTPAETVARVTFGKFTIHGEAGEAITAAFKRAAEIAESDDPNKAFEQIVTDWASLTDGVPMTLEMEVTRLNKKYGVVLGLVQEGETEGETETTETETTTEAETPAAVEPVAEAAPAAKKTRAKKA